jgi:hypothetical protein
MLYSIWMIFRLLLSYRKGWVSLLAFKIKGKDILTRIELRSFDL